MLIVYVEILRLSRFIEAIKEQIDCVYVLLYCPASSAVTARLSSVINYTYGFILETLLGRNKKVMIFFYHKQEMPQTLKSSSTLISC